jgi:hypothetical protein
VFVFKAVDPPRAQWKPREPSWKKGDFPPMCVTDKIEEIQFMQMKRIGLYSDDPDEVAWHKEQARLYRDSVSNGTGSSGSGSSGGPGEPNPTQ